VEYIEVRCLDLDPFSPLGLNAPQVDFLDLFLLGCLLRDSPRIDDAECERLDDNYKDVINEGRHPDLKLTRCDQSTPVMDASREALDDLRALAEQLDQWQGGTRYREALEVQRNKVEDPSLLPSARVLAAMEDTGQGHRDWTLSLSREHQRALQDAVPDEEVRADFERMTRESLEEQRTMEEADQGNFARFLENYLAS